ncbi:MAG: carboxypeptidase regulatory-like domain-containing protein [Planctomicrobium sp.]|nr:carboxypeptidase regulatory-like domain-containing protein [Planctomicrobium sp.]
MKFHVLAVIIFSSALCGCGGDGRPSLVEVEGAVTLDGEPIGGAQLAFIPDAGNEIQRGSRATSDSGGKFTVGTYAVNDGIPVGKYKVTVIKEELDGELPEGYNTEDPSANAKPMKMKLFTPEHYSLPDQTDLTVEVTSDGMSPATIALEGGGGPVIKTQGGRPADEP